MNKATAMHASHSPRRKPPGRKTPVVGFADGMLDAKEMSAKAHAARWGTDRRTLVALAQEKRPEAFEKIIQLMRTAEKEEVQRDCAALVLSYSDGRPRQSVDVNIGGPRDLTMLSTPELEAIAAGAPPPFALQYQGNIIDAEVVESVP